MFGFSKRSRAARTAVGPLADFYAVPSPSKTTPLADLELLAVDVETTGMDVRRDSLLSIGWVPVTRGVIELGGARHHIVRVDDLETVGDSATVHHLTDDQVAAGEEPETVIGHFLTALQGRGMLAHFSVLEEDFIGKACQEYFGGGLVVPVVDTFDIERMKYEDKSLPPQGDDLRLARVRQRYGLPNYQNHNALTDALACAELYLAMVARSRGTVMRHLQR